MKLLSAFVLLVITMPSMLPDRVGGIEYSFSEEVDEALSVYIDELLSEAPELQAFVILGTQDTATSYISVGTYRGQAPPGTEHLLVQTNRFVSVAGREVPVIFESDFAYGVARLEDGRVIRKSLVSHYYTIVFTRRGRVVKAGML